jgi:hypothetical protein
MIASEPRRRAGVARAVLIALGLSVGNGTCCSVEARADEANKIVAEQLFSAGRALLEGGQVDAACEKLSESQRLDAAGGTAVLLGLCYVRQGKLASAWAALHSARALAVRDGRRDRIDVSDATLAEIEPQLARVVVEVAPGARAPGLEVTLDGVSLSQVSEDVPIPIDTGRHELRASAVGHLPSIIPFAIAAGPGTTRVRIEPLAPEPTAPAIPRNLSAPMPDSQNAFPSSSGARLPSAVDLQSRRAERLDVHARQGSSVLPAAIAGGVGVVALGVTGFFGVEALLAESEKPTSCAASDSACSDRWHTLENRRATDATIATISGGVAIATAATAIILWLSVGHRKNAQTSWMVAPLNCGGAVVASF